MGHRLTLNERSEPRSKTLVAQSTGARSTKQMSTEDNSKKRKSHLLHSTTDSRLALYNDNDGPDNKKRRTNELVLDDSSNKQIQVASVRTTLNQIYILGT
jgi:hypothetical protein